MLIIYIRFTFLFRAINLFKYLLRLGLNQLIISYFTWNLIYSCIISIIIRVKQIEFILWIENNKPSKGLVDVSSINLLAESLVNLLEELLDITVKSEAFALFIWENQNVLILPSFHLLL